MWGSVSELLYAQICPSLFAESGCNSLTDALICRLGVQKGEMDTVSQPSFLMPLFQHCRFPWINNPSDSKPLLRSERHKSLSADNGSRFWQAVRYCVHIADTSGKQVQCWVAGDSCRRVCSGVCSGQLTKEINRKSAPVQCGIPDLVQRRQMFNAARGRWRRKRAGGKEPCARVQHVWGVVVYACAVWFPHAHSRARISSLPVWKMQKRWAVTYKNHLSGLITFSVCISRAISCFWSPSSS